LIGNIIELPTSGYTRQLADATDLNNVTFYDYEEPTDDDNLLSSYFKKKIENYKKQDKEAKRKIPKDNYINVEWFFDNVGKVCPILKENFRFIKNKIIK
jgi:hypothetical protein